MVTIATWNVNSIKARIANVLDWLCDAGPDVVLLQELKCTEESFPRLEIEALGYQVAAVGQKSYNGVAILSKAPIEQAIGRLPGEPEDEQARYIEATTFGLRVASIYLPNGNPTNSDKYPYKLRWMARLESHVRDLLASEQPVVLGGDYNICPADLDVHDPAGFRNDALCRPESRQAFRRILNLGMTEAFRALHPGRRAYSYWDYMGRAFDTDDGLRIDHFLLSPQAADRLESCDIDKAPRGRDKASDHTPVVCAIAA